MRVPLSVRECAPECVGCMCAHLSVCACVCMHVFACARVHACEICPLPSRLRESRSPARRPPSPRVTQAAATVPVRVTCTSPL